MNPFRGFLDRRKAQQTPAEDRRKPHQTTMQEAKDRVDAALEDLERTITGAGKTKLQHQSGKHDDRVRAAAQAYITRHHMDTLAERSKKKYAHHHGELPPLDELALQYAAGSRMSVGD